MSVSASVVEITPDMAKKWRALGKNFRKIDVGIVGRIADDILNGRWEMNGQAIILNGSGEVKDGQHRLAAIEKAGKPVRCLVVRGIVEGESIDSGRPRSLTDHLKYRGFKYAGVMAPAVQWAIRLSENVPAWKWSRAVQIRKGIQFVDQNPGLQESCAMCAQGGDSKVIAPVGLLAGFHYVTATKDRDLADKFVRALYVGGGGIAIDPDDTMNLLRTRLIESKSARVNRMTTVYKAALMVKTWNSWRGGYLVQTLKWIATGPRSEEFPAIE